MQSAMPAHCSAIGAVASALFSASICPTSADVLTFSDLRLSVDLDDGQRRGRTKLDPKGAFTRVAMAVNPAPVRRMLFERVLPAGALAEEAMA